MKLSDVEKEVLKIQKDYFSSTEDATFSASSDDLEKVSKKISNKWDKKKKDLIKKRNKNDDLEKLNNYLKIETSSK